MHFQKTIQALAAILICTFGARLQAAESTSATNSASTNTFSTNSTLTILSPITVIAQDVTNGVVEGTDFRNPGGFGPIDSKAATRTFTPNMENPVSVQVIPQEILKSQQTIYLDDAIQNVAGVIPENSTTGGGISDSFSIRGFDMDNLSFEDGLRSDAYLTFSPRSMQNVENVEVVKGPAAVLYGQAQPGGLVNIDTKKPLTTNYFAIDQQVGSFAFYRTTVDASGPIDTEKKFLYRFNLDQQNNYSYRDYIKAQRLFLFPTFRWQPTDKTEATLELTYANTHQVYDNGIPFQENGNPASVGRSANFANSAVNQFPDTEFGIKFSTTHKFNDDWMIHGALKEYFQNGPALSQQYYGGAVSQNGDLEIDPYGNPKERLWSQEFLADLTGKFTTWFLKHTAILGFDYYHQGFCYSATYGNPLTNNIYAPVSNLSSPLGDGFNGSAYNNDTAFFAQDQVEFPYKIFGMAGFRYDSVSTANTGAASYGAIGQACNVAVTPRFGLLWRPINPVSFYGSYTANFGASPVYSQSGVGGALPPESAQQWEIGMKGETPNKKLSSTLSFYQLTKNNIPQTDPSNPLYSIPVGQAQSKGMEIQLAGEILPGWKLIGAYSYINAVITQSQAYTDVAGNYNPSQEGQRLTGVPYNSGGVWSTYELQSGPFKRLRFGAGVVYRSQEVTYVTDANGNYAQEQIPGFAVVNLMAAYPFDLGKSKWTAQVNVDNLFNTYYFTTITPYSAMPGAPVSFMASLKAEF